MDLSKLSDDELRALAGGQFSLINLTVIAYFLGAMAGQILLLALLYAGSGSSDRPLLRSATFNTCIGLLIFFLAGAGQGNGSQFDFSNWEIRIVAAFVVAALDQLRLRGRHQMHRKPRSSSAESAHRRGIVWTVICLALTLAFSVLAIMLPNGSHSSSIGPLFVGFAAVALIASFMAYPFSRMIEWSRQP